VDRLRHVKCVKFNTNFLTVYKKKITMTKKQKNIVKIYFEIEICFVSQRTYNPRRSLNKHHVLEIKWATGHTVSKAGHVIA